MPPREVIDRTVDKSGAGGAVEEGGRTALTTAGHLAFGAAAGALYAAALDAASGAASTLSSQSSSGEPQHSSDWSDSSDRSDRSDRLDGSSVMAGIAYGLIVWALAYGVGLPSLGLHPAATDDTKDRNQVLIASHIVWGATLGRLTREHSRSRA